MTTLTNAQAKELYDALVEFVNSNEPFGDITSAAEDMSTEEVDNETIPERDRDDDGDILDAPTDEIIDTFKSVEDSLNNLIASAAVLRNLFRETLADKKGVTKTSAAPKSQK